MIYKVDFEGQACKQIGIILIHWMGQILYEVS